MINLPKKKRWGDLPASSELFVGAHLENQVQGWSLKFKRTEVK